MTGIAVRARGVLGEVKAFLLSPPVTQKSIFDLAAFVAPGEFRGQRVLILGGSRGLGELTAKTIAAGGGYPVITWHSGRTDAERVAAEIRAFGANCDVLRYDATRPAADQFRNILGEIGFAYYFATSQISRRRSRSFDAALFQDFLNVYVYAFHDLCEFLSARAGQTLRVFYPSSVFVEETPPELTEYAMAKAAAEVFCAGLHRSFPTIKVLTRRLPRLATDQTLSVVPVETPDSMSVMLPIIREMQMAVRI
jgi:NADP-dependent 3-hydroxy acid dehydrogenase YdfG